MAPQRSDRAEKLQLRKVNCETVVKCSLGGVLTDVNGREALLSAIRLRVQAYSKRIHIASLAANLLVREIFTSVPDEVLHTVSLPDFTNQTFIFQLLTGTEKAQLPNPIITNLYSRHPELAAKLSDAKRQYGDRNIYAAGATKYGTNIKNHFVVNFTRFVKSFIYSRDTQRLLKQVMPDEACVSKEAATAWLQSANKLLLYHLHAWPLDTCTVQVTHLPKRLQHALRIQKQILGTDPVTEKWKKDNIDSIIQYVVYINRFLQRKGDKLYNILPLCAVKAHFITVDTEVLHGILSDAGYIDNKLCNKSTFCAYGADQWKSIFRLEKITGKNKTFTGTLDTDGTSGCFHFMRPKVLLSTGAIGVKKNNTVDFQAHRALIEKILKEDPDVEIIGIDPGRTNIMYAVKVVDGVVKTYKLTRGQYYYDSGILLAREQSEKWQQEDHIKDALEEMADSSPKGIDLPTFRRYVETVMRHYDTRWDEYLHPKWAQQRLRLYGGKKKVFAEFFNKIQTPGKRVIVAFGAAKFAPVGKGELAVPTSRAFKECGSRFPTFPTDEFRTTKVYNGDKTTVLQTVKRNDSGKQVRGLLWCRSTITKESKFINRDLNAALNIRDCLLLAERPTMLCRAVGSKRQEKLKVTVGKHIRC
jgi:hypothetical protein